MSQPLVVGLVSCSKRKLCQPAPAKELYNPSYVFSRSVRYVESCCDEWWVLSARHGLVHPDTVLEPYDENLSEAPKAVREEWIARVRRALLERYEGRRVRFIVMAGSSYARAVDGLGAEVEEPLKGLGAGHRRRWLATHTRRCRKL
jgi:hypothetical protein